MNEKALKVLEYNKIINMLAGFAGSAMGKKLCEDLLPMTELEKVRTAQKETADATQRIYKSGSLSFNGVPDIRGDIKLLEVGSSLLASELLKISSVLTATLRVKTYGGTVQEGEEGDSLTARFEGLEPVSQLNNEIRRCILSEEEIADDASPELSRIRRQIHLTNDKIREQLNKIVNSKEAKDRLQDNIITMRNGRYCLPVKSEYKTSFDGMIHDQSAKGSTIFIEPAVVVKLNNDLAELSLKEAKEIEKILAELSAFAGQYTEALDYDIRTLTELDFIFAKGSLAKSMRACEPEFNQNGYVSIRKGRHPLIDKAKVVPIDVYVGSRFNLLVVTGPNTGGKTVTLKTVGLFCLMGQAGLHIPAQEGSKLSVFKEIFADIGDEQSIEQSLSTFSSHMTNIVRILKEADKHSLVLFDELCAGTDPTEGAALAQAILTDLHARGARVVATTHYPELKIYALSTPGVSNACCEFDIETLKPTYRLLIGIPGKSNAFEISRKLGLGNDIIEMADSFVGTKDKSFEDVISDLDQRRTKMERDEERTASAREEAENLKRRFEEKNEKLEASRDRILREANEEARRIVEEAKEYADEAIKRLNKLGADFNMADLERERTALRDRVSENSKALAVKRSEKTNEDDSNKEIMLGDVVCLVNLNIEGVVTSLPDAKGVLGVRAGAMQTKVSRKDIRWISRAVKEPENKKGGTKSSMSKAMTIHPELNLVGMRVDEALPVLEKYLDDAYLSHLPKCTIIHGRGTGALKEAVHKHLKKLKYVAEFRLGSFGEGDAGVTIVTFK